MKKTRDDGFLSSQPESLAISNGVALGQPGRAHMSTNSREQKLTTNQALTYLKAVKEHFQDRKDNYDEFLEVMKDFKAQRIDTSGVIMRVKELFKGNRDLILGFNSFLPKGHEIPLSHEDDLAQKKKPIEFEEAMSFVGKIKTRFQGDDHVYKAFLDILIMYKKDAKSITDVYHEVSVLFEDHYDLLVEFTHFLPHVSGAASIFCSQLGKNSLLLGNDRGYPTTTARPIQVEKKPAVSFVSCTENANFSDEKQLNHAEKPNDNSEGWKHDREHVDDLDHKRRSVHQYDLTADQFHRGVLDPEAAFCEKVKEAFQDPENYEKISDCIRSYKSKFYPASQFRKLISSLIGKHPDLMVACEDFITYIEETGGLRHSRQVFRSSKVDGDGEDHGREDKCENSDQDLKERDRNDRGISLKDAHGQKMPPYGGREKFMLKSIQDLDLSNCESCTPSYRLLPDNYPMPSASRRTDIGDEVLNDRWVSVTSGSEDYSFKHMRKNQYEESLFRCEDDRFELDMLLESVNATVKCVEGLVDHMNASNKADNTFFIDEHLTALNLRCIERLYGEHGLDVIDVLRRCAPLALPVVLSRMKQKQEEWARCRADFNKVWAEIYTKNYHKSLDHRSFYFKQQDTKNLSAKALLAEIKEMSENNQNEDEMLLFVGAGLTQPNRPQLEFEYSDPDIHEDLYQLIKYSSGQICTPEQCDKVMKIWIFFLEPMLGLPIRHSSGEENDCHVDVIACVKTSDTSRHAVDLNGCRMHMPHYNDCGVSGDAFLSVDKAADKSDMLVNPHQNVPSTKFLRGEQIGTLVEGTAAEEAVREDDALAAPTGCADVDDGQVETVPIRIPQKNISTKANSSLVSEEVKDQKHRHEIEARSKCENEGHESSPNKNLESSNFTALGNTCGKMEQTPNCARSIEDVEGSGQCSSDTENASENADVSASESANGEDCSPDENDNKAESEDSIIHVHETEGATLISDQSLQTVKPLVLGISKALHGVSKKSEIFYGTDSFYLLFRLHQMLYERMQSAKFHSLSPENKWKILNDVHQADPYARFKDALHNLLNGSSDSAKFEDECRAIVGAQSYILFTLDKLIHKLIKQMQIIATEDSDSRVFHLHSYERLRNQETFADAVYHENARFLIPDDNLYRIEYFPSRMRMIIQLMKNDHDKPEPTAVSMDPSFASYLNHELLTVVPNRKEKHRVFMERHIRKLYPGDEYSAISKAMEGLVILNSLEMKFNCNTSKISYVLDTKDIMVRRGRAKRALHQDCCYCRAKRIKLPLNNAY